MNKTIECITLFGQKKVVPAESLIFRPSVYGFIEADNKILVMKMKNNGKYTFPGGGIEKGETTLAALKREVKEEIGIETTHEQFFAAKENFFFFDPWNEAWHSLLFFYTCKPISLDVLDIEKLNGDETESTEPAWIDVGTLDPNDFFEGAVSVVEKYLLK